MIYQYLNEKSNYQKFLELVHGLNIHNFKNLNLQKKWLSSFVLFCSLLFLSSNSLTANNLVIGTPTIVGSNIAVTISWDNSWSTTVTPANFDAVWVFVKRQACSNNLYNQALVSTVSANHAITGSVLQVDAVTDGMGVFVRRSSSGNGNIATETLTLALQTAANGADNFQVFGIEMVNIPQGNFFIGDGVGCSNNNFFNLLITSATQAAGLGVNGNYICCGLGSAGSLLSTFPLGFNSFYCMKYEISQQQYASFLNSLTFTQQLARTAVNPASAVGSFAIASAATPCRNFIRIRTVGVSGITPAVYGCDLNSNGIFDEAADGQNIACGWLSWSDLMAYLDWAALRPMTEFEYEKVCRGAAPASLCNEYAWNSTAITQAVSSSLNNAGQVSETSTAAGNGLCAFGGNGTTDGPLRCGFAAGAATTKAQAGAAWYGVMEMSGNVWEQCVGGRQDFNYGAFTSACGDGALTSAGAANTANWPPTGGGQGGGIIRGGGFADAGGPQRISDRVNVNSNPNTSRNQSVGGRGVR
jgi:formylglycine-generating enzyme required for sulfatase activity